VNGVTSAASAPTVAQPAAQTAALSQVGSENVPSSSRAAVLSWTPPQSNTNGTALTDLSGYKIFYGVTQEAMTQVAIVSDATASSFVVENLAPGNWFFTVVALSGDGVSSPVSTMVSVSL